MSLKTEIEQGIKTAMLAKDADVLRTLRSIKSLILLEETSGAYSGALPAEAEMKLLVKAAKQRRDSLEVFQAQGREDLAAKERIELEIIERYLPKALDPAELEARIQAIITELGAQGPGDMGKVMGQASKALAGQADGKAIAAKVAELLKK